jgi:hypothetical protein
MAFEHEHTKTANHWDALTPLVDGALMYYSPAKGGPDGAEPWRRADRQALAEALAIHISAGMGPDLDRRVHDCVMSTLAELQRPRDIYVRPNDPVEERRLFWVPDQAAQASAVEMLANSPGGAASYAYIPMVQPGKTFGVWTHGQEIITVRPAVLVGPRSDGKGNGYTFTLRKTLSIARTALAWRPGTVAAALVGIDGKTVVIEKGSNDSEFATSEQQREEGQA